MSVGDKGPTAFFALHCTPAAAGGSPEEELRRGGGARAAPGSGNSILRDKSQSPGRTPASRRAESSGSALMEEKQILCVGLVVLDIINVVDKYPEEDADSR